MELNDIKKWEILRNKSIEDPLWSDFRKEVFPYNRINLNPSTFGSISTYVKNTRETFHQNEQEAYPLGLYQKGRQQIRCARLIAKNLWGSPTHHLCIGQSSTQAQNLLMLNILLLWYRDNKSPPFIILTTNHEHSGGVDFFLNHKEIHTEFLPDKAIFRLDEFKKEIERVQPALVFVSHFTYDQAIEIPIQTLASLVKETLPSCIVVIDFAQSLGLMPIELNDNIDFAFASTHKWLMGPYGAGLMWVHYNIFDQLERIYWSGERLDDEYIASGFEMAGGQSFELYASLTMALLLYSTLGIDMVLKRSSFFIAYFSTTLDHLFKKRGVSVEYSARRGFSRSPEFNLKQQGYFSIHFKNLDSYLLYDYLNQNGIHTKCIKKENMNILRIGIPYYETKERLDQALHLIDAFLSQEEGAVSKINL